MGDKIKITGDMSVNLKNSEFTVVGTVDSVLYLGHDYGNTSIGDGKLSSFIFINRDNFTLEAYTEVYITAANLEKVTAYSKEYDFIASQVYDDLLKVKSDRETDAKWYISDRDEIPGYSFIKSGVDMITSVAGVFPIFFILIAVLMTSNSMARMIEEERNELGTLTSLGYKDKNIISTYLFYVLSATGLGAVIGFFTGSTLIPKIIYTIKFILPPLIIRFDMIIFVLILLVSFAVMTFVTVFSCYKELKQKPAYLMRPVPPKRGQTILLQRIEFIWNHLSFTWKVTMRNMFRYKKRALMTIIGVACCTGLLLAAFGFRDSMDGVAEKQYTDVFKYDDMIVLKNESQTINGELESLFTKDYIVDPVLINQTSYKCDKNGKILDAYMIVPENEDGFNSYYNLVSTLNGDTIHLNESGIVVTQKLAQVLNVGKGDSITVTDSDNNLYTFTVSDVSKNYLLNYIYMDKALYVNVFGKPPAYNSVVSDHDNSDEKALAERLIDSGQVVNVVFNSDVKQQAADENNSLNTIIIMIIIIAALLAVVVLYNLTSINISERKREIATLKVLGFKDGETNAYIYREAIILTIISIIVGLVLGVFLDNLIIGIFEDESSVLIRQIHLSSFIWAALITIAFSVLMQVFTYIKLKRIDMIESLKSVE
ncbi:MAG: ABC transporter permease, partial [Clostridiales bacterium]|jgi:putative ABC transport system permease protein|nr:ABC transporter permease [Clostridiales bacterium]